ARGEFVRSRDVALRQDAGTSRVLDVKKSARNHEVLIDELRLDEYQHLGRGRRISPALEVDVPRFHRYSRGKRTLAYQGENPRVLQVIVEHLIELLGQPCELLIAGLGGRVRDLQS